MGKAKEIIDGWMHLAFKNDAVEKIATARLNICNTCEYNSRRKNSLRPDVHCMKCGCTLASKVRSMESECPIGKWPSIKQNNEKQEIRDTESPIK